LDLSDGFRSRTTALIERITSGTDTVQLMHALCRELLELATGTPVVVTVDDVQHADPESLTWLLCLARRMAAAPVLVVLTSDLGPYQDFASTRAELLRLSHGDVTHTAPLSSKGVATVLKER